MEGAFLNIEKAGRNMGLTINHGCEKTNLKNIPSSTTIGRYDFERVDEFKYLESTVTYSNDISYEIKQSVQELKAPDKQKRVVYCTWLRSLVGNHGIAELDRMRHGFTLVAT
ncbi:hypothetical protein ANN_26679 [Periplaneta americana]|uniref:Uncharacterized protein n=1 Tax=Periplaneta americana TaxID=6978 RepID=A0ABQ8RYX3_PERAM|nr:hypothetical protein ANN_26679 [Periplaneta americana]